MMYHISLSILLEQNLEGIVIDISVRSSEQTIVPQEIRPVLVAYWKLYP